MGRSVTLRGKRPFIAPICLTDSGMLIAIFSYGGMPHDEARRSMRLFAETVMPRLKARPPQSPFDAA